VTRINTVALCGLRTLPGLRRHCPSQLRFGARCSKVREALSREMFRRRRVGWICARVILLANSAGRRWAGGGGNSHLLSKPSFIFSL
jgi:hypothetical protein